MSKVSIIAIALLALVMLGVWYLHSRNVEINPGNSSGPIFTVASSTGADYLTVTADGKVGVGTDVPQAPLDVAGAIRLSAKSAEGCGANTEGEIAYNPDNKHFWGCDGASWRQLDQ